MQLLNTKVPTFPTVARESTPVPWQPGVLGENVTLARRAMQRQHWHDRTRLAYALGDVVHVLELQQHLAGGSGVINRRTEGCGKYICVETHPRNLKSVTSYEEMKT